MQQRQLRLGDTLDDYCPRERRLTNHAVVAMVGDDVKQTRCTTCDAEHEYKHAKVPRPRKKIDAPAALQGQPPVLPKRVAPPALSEATQIPTRTDGAAPAEADAAPFALDPTDTDTPPADERAHDVTDETEPPDFEGPVHRRLIRAALPRHEGQQSQARSAPDFTIRQPTGGRPNRFRPRQGRPMQGAGGNRSGQPAGSFGNRAGGHGAGKRGGSPGHGGNRPPGGRPAKHHHQGRKGPK